MTELPEDREWTPRAKEETGPFQVDKEWLAEHHISTAELAALGRTTLADLGVDASPWTRCWTVRMDCRNAPASSI